jgi:hypothetical protein
VRNPVTVDAAEYAALRAVATAALTWSQGTLSGLDLDETIRRHRAVLDQDQDPGLHLAWPEADEEREPVPGVDYLPEDRWGYEREVPDTAATSAPTPGRHGFDPTTDAEGWDWAQLDRRAAA